MRFYFIFLFASLIFLQKTGAQPDIDQAIFAEIKGAGANLTLNYDARFSKKMNGIGGRVGFGYFGNRFQNAISIPVEINFLAGQKNNFLEIGSGMVWENYRVNSNDQKGFVDLYMTPLHGWAFFMSAGYRYQQPGKILFRINFTPIFAKNKIYPLPGMSIGYSF